MHEPKASSEPSQDAVIDVPPDPAEVVQAARDRFNEGRTRPIKFRRKQLAGVLRFVRENEQALLDALHQDLRKPKQEAMLMEIIPLVKDVEHMLNHLEEWTRPERPKKAMVNWMDGVMVYNDPYGVVLVMGAWNYPLQLTMTPVIGAIAAGNAVVIKPSDLSPATSQLLHALLPRYLDPSCYPVYLGGVPETTLLLEQRFDYIFYTGGAAVGQIVHRAAARHLTPATLELGGKSPAYVDASADLDTAVKRILWGKCVNAGQTCVAPDYVLCTRDLQDRLVRSAEKALLEFFGGDARASPDLGRIVSERHFRRLVALLAGLKVALGGRHDEKERFIEPTVAVDVGPNHPVMQEEVFGPILPVVPVAGLEQAVAFINARDKPLALYVFSARKEVRQALLERTSSGGVCVNDTILHLAVEDLPFGGVGRSGMGAYHGKTTFDTFTHKKSVLVRDFQALPEKILASRYPPYSDAKIAFVKLGLKERRRLPLQWLPYLLVFVLGAAATVAAYYLYEYAK